jgi:hypothetical protein
MTTGDGDTARHQPQPAPPPHHTQQHPHQYHPTMNATLALPTVATTAQADELGQQVDEMLAAYHGHPVQHAKRAQPRTPLPIAATGVTAAPAGDAGGGSPPQPPTPVATGRPASRPPITFYGELRAHPLRLAVIVAASVPAGWAIAQLALGASLGLWPTQPQPITRPGYVSSTSTPAPHLSTSAPHRAPLLHAPARHAPSTRSQPSHAASTHHQRQPSHAPPRHTPPPTHSRHPSPSHSPRPTHPHSPPPTHTHEPPPTPSTPAESHPEVSPS